MVNIPDAIDQHLLVHNDLRDYNHVPSGKLSAGRLSHPNQWQVLHYLGVPKTKPPLKKLHDFERGNILEDAVIRTLERAGHQLESQKFVEYRNTVGYLDILLEGHPVEVKSVKSNEWKSLKEAKWGHILQCCLYALALDKDDFSLLYVKPDTFEVKQFDFKTDKWKAHVDTAIDCFERDIKHYEETQEVPGFEPKEFWHNADSINPYPKFKGFTTRFKFAINK